MKKTCSCLVVVFLLVSVGSIAWADSIVKQIYYQRKTTLSVPKTYTIKFSLWEADSGGATPVWEEEKQLHLSNSTLKTYLGDENSLDGVDFSQQLWVQVERKVKAGYVPVGPREMIGIVPYAIWSEVSGSGGGGGSTLTGVTAGSGLTGGGSFGNVTLNVGAGSGISAEPDSISIAPGGVTNSMLADNAVTSVKIADNQIGESDLASGAVTKSKLSPSGGSSGQVLGTDGTNLTWQSLDSIGGWVDDGTVVRLASGMDRVGIGTATPGSSNKLEVNGYTVIGSDSKGIRMRTDGSAVDLESLGSSLAINYGLGLSQNTYLNVYGGNVGIGTETPQQKLHVGGIARFDVGGGQISVSSPGGWPGLIAYSQNGHRRDMAVRDGGMSLEVSTSSSAPPTGNGITISETGGNVGIGTVNPQQKLHVAGLARFDLPTGQINVSTPGGWPGMIAFAPNGHRRDVIVWDGGISIEVSSSTSAPPTGNGITIYETGRLVTRELEITGGSDLSERFEIRNSREEIPLEPGLVVTIDPENPGSLIVSSQPYDRRVAGIISGAGGLKPGMLMGQKGSKADGGNPVALTGRVYCWADASKGSIEPGDLLTTSQTPGHAMKVTNYTQAQGAILGKAMSSLKSGQGLILVLVSLQ